MSKRRQSGIQRDANEYAETVLRFYKADSPDLPALPNPEAALYDTVEFWLDMQWEMPPQTRSEIAGAAVGHAREVLALEPDGDDILFLIEHA